LAQKPSIPKGTRDFSPIEVVKRNYIMNTIRSCFTNYGFQPIETPSFENSETLMGKYGEEGDRLIFKILDSGDYFKDIRLRTSDTFRNLKRFETISKYINGDNKYYKTREGFKAIASQSYPRPEETPELTNFLTNFLVENFEDIIYQTETYDNSIESVTSFIFKGYLEKFILNSYSSTKYITEKALRYDLTVPFARYVVQHQNDITFPFKRYQIQPVWRADRPQKGRFREFYQCDADVVGSTSLWQEVEFIQLYDAVFSKLNLKGVTIKMNNRKVLSGIAEVIEESDKLIDFTVALDKLDKIGEEGVKAEMLSKGIAQTAIDKVQPLFEARGSASEKLAMLTSLLKDSETGMKGVEELRFIIKSIGDLGLNSANVEIDVTLARGLNYYTGAIFEVAAPEGVSMGSIGGGGRYDDLTGIFGLKNMSGVGISFGLDRIYLVLEELELFPETVSANTKVLFINFGEAESLYAMKAIKQLREQGIAAELYPDSVKMGKQMGYADKRSIPFTVLAGSSEIASDTFTLKNMKMGDQETVNLSQLTEKLS